MSAPGRESKAIGYLFPWLLILLAVCAVSVTDTLQGLGIAVALSAAAIVAAIQSHSRPTPDEQYRDPRH